jgi:hypothetical protein
MDKFPLYEILERFDTVGPEFREILPFQDFTGHTIVFLEQSSPVKINKRLVCLLQQN